MSTNDTANEITVAAGRAESNSAPRRPQVQRAAWRGTEVLPDFSTKTLSNDSIQSGGEVMIAATSLSQPPVATEELNVPCEWPPHPMVFGTLMTPVEAAQYLRLDQTGSHTPESAIRTLKYFREQGQLKATKYARHVWFRKEELDKFLENKTEE